MLNKWAPRIAILVGCAVVASGMTASASIPSKIPNSKTGKITACVAKKGGAVRFIDAQRGAKCKKSEKKVGFNQNGPTGPAGPAGQRGPSDAFVADRDDVKSLNQMQVGPNTVLTLSLPAGSFVISANTSVIATTDDTTVTCSLLAGTGTLTATAGATPASKMLQPLALAGTYTNTSPGSVGLLCQPSGPAFPNIGLGEARGATLVATQVGSITGP